MKLKTKFVLALPVFTIMCYKAQAIGPAIQPDTLSFQNDYHFTAKKGSFFIAPYYQYSHFQKLKLISHTNRYTLLEGESTYVFSQSEIAEYNDNYKTDYTNGLAGIRVGYQALKGLGLNAFIGVNHFNFRSWISDENTQSFSTSYPALTFGGAVDYVKALNANLYVIGYSSLTFSTTASVSSENNSGEDVVKSQMKSLMWDADLALAWRIKRFRPYAGAGFTQQYIYHKSTERIAVTDDNGNSFYNTTTFDSHVNGTALYGFAGLEYKATQYLSFFARSTFINPMRITAGLKVLL
jgi:hypothetical protein